MCKAFSAIVLDSGKVLWKPGVDSHAAILMAFGIPDKELPAKFAKVEISPANGSYLQPDKWVFRLDEEVKPEWWNTTYEMDARKALAQWKRKLYAILVRKPIVNPFEDRKPPKKITKKHLALLKEWASVSDSVRDGVSDSMWDSVRYSMWASMWDSVRDSVRYSMCASVSASVSDSVRASVRAYMGSFFKLPRKSWKYTDDINTKNYPFQPAVDLWMMGIVPAFDGNEWMLLGGKDAHILWKGKV